MRKQQTQIPSSNNQNKRYGDMDLDILKHSSTFVWATILIWSLELNSRSCQAVPVGSSAERVHIRLHMPEVVRQHTHFHNVYKYPKTFPQHSAPAPASAPGSGPVPVPAPTSANLKLLGKPHVQLLGYTTATGDTGSMSPSLMQLMATAVAPTHMPPAPTSLTPNYGPALFDSFNQEMLQDAASLSATPKTTERPIPKPAMKQQLLQQFFTPNVISALQQPGGKREEVQDSSLEEDYFEKNSLLNLNFLEALQREYLSKFGGRRKRKKSSLKFGKTRPKDYHAFPQKNAKPYYYQENREEDDPSEHFQDYSDEPQDDYEEVMLMESSSKWGGFYPPETDLDDGQGYDSAVAFSDQDNSISGMPTVEDFLDDANNHPQSDFGNFYDPHPNRHPYPRSYGGSNEMASQPSQPWLPSQTTANNWVTPTTPTSTHPSKGIRLRPRSPGSGQKVRYVKLVTRKKRKNRDRIRTKRYRP
ncbi:uncharacterized protein LOC117590109 [Drosophila guanche]|uniref:uncharacterized protein LOC117590109 n=1 Tax=Drosophila guanche TaxID=7266 RepID=UPI001470FB5A|nr:uncharacterized protein LOC117590109 [Drosophila guanche]